MILNMKTKLRNAIVATNIQIHSLFTEALSFVMIALNIKAKTLTKLSNPSNNIQMRVTNCRKRNYNDTPEWVISINETSRLRYLKSNGVIILERKIYTSENWYGVKFEFVPKFKSLNELNKTVKFYTEALSQ